MILRYAILATSVALATQAHASETEAQVTTGWLTEDFTAEYNQKGSATEDVTYSGVKTGTTDTSAPSIRFSCSEQYGLKASLSLKPLDSFDPEKLQVMQDRMRWKIQKFTIRYSDRDGSERPPWAYVKQTGDLQTLNETTARQIFNTVIRGETFELKGVTFDPPEVDEQFVAFAQSCPITSS